MDNIPALSARRVRAALSERGQEFDTSDVDDTVVSVKGHDIWLLIAGGDGTIFSVSGTDKQAVELDRLSDVRRFIGYWHSQTHWPVCSFSVGDDDGVRLTAQVSTDWPAGVTDEQLVDQIDIGVSNIVAAFREFNRFLADPDREEYQSWLS